MERVTVIVDGANVMGARADGWWRDRAAAMARLHGQLASLADRGLTRQPTEVSGVPQGSGVPGAPPVSGVLGAPWYPEFVLVVEGKAKAGVPALGETSRVRILAAPGSGDDAIADLAASLPGRRLVVTADRELRRRSMAAGAAVVGPRWLLDLL